MHVPGSRRAPAAAVFLAALVATGLPVALHAEHYSTAWLEGYPQRALPTLKPGIDTRETVIAALGQPQATISLGIEEIHDQLRGPCRTSAYQPRLENVLRYEETLAWGKTRMRQRIHVFFDASGKLCGADVLRRGGDENSIDDVRAFYVDNPKGWAASPWKTNRGWY